MPQTRFGMIGGGPESLMGNVHRSAAKEANYVLVCGAFSRSIEKSQTLKKELNNKDLRLYLTYEQMLQEESNIPIEKRMEVVSIVTPNNQHFLAASLALQLGFDVILEKPITLTFLEAEALEEIALKHNKKICVNYTFTGYHSIQIARQMILNGEIGTIRKVELKFHQGWLHQSVDNSHASWRTDPTKCGLAGTVADIGTHAFHLAEYITALRINQLCALTAHHVEGHTLDDDASVLLKFDNNATGLISVMQMAIGKDNFSLSVFGEKGTLKWSFNKRNQLEVYKPQPSSQLFKPADCIIHKVDEQLEPDYKALASHYLNFALDIKDNPTPVASYPNLTEGVRGMAWIEAVITSQKNQTWISLKHSTATEQEFKDEDKNSLSLHL